MANEPLGRIARRLARQCYLRQNLIQINQPTASDSHSVRKSRRICSGFLWQIIYVVWYRITYYSCFIFKSVLLNEYIRAMLYSFRAWERTSILDVAFALSRETADSVAFVCFPVFYYLNLRSCWSRSGATGFFIPHWQRFGQSILSTPDSWNAT
jgi:hypothetical protein